MRNGLHPFHPIVYVRGFAATQGEIEETVADPYMGFNIGSTKARKSWTGDVQRYFFESPLVRLMSDHKYEDVFVDGDDLVWAELTDKYVPYKSIIIHRYYDDASKDFGDGEGKPITHFARKLGDLILRLRERICANPENVAAGITPGNFRVYLVAHSMGGLVCRSFLQNQTLVGLGGAPLADARAAVDKLFTYATPHNGIDMRIVGNVPGWLSFGDVNNFNRTKMKEYLGLNNDDDVSSVKPFKAERVFNLIGTNPGDYKVAGGLSSWAAGEASDGLVRIENATTHAKVGDQDVTSPRAFVHRSHSGHYGIVNSEEGYQNLTRFLFGTVRADGFLDVDDISLPSEVQAKFDAGAEVRASYQFEIAVSVRGCQWQMTRREARENSAIFRTYNDLFPGADRTNRPPDRTKSPHLFSIFLDPTKSKMKDESVSFAFDIKVLVPDYVVDRMLFMDRHYEGGYIYRKLLLVEVHKDEAALGGRRVEWNYQSLDPSKGRKLADTRFLDDQNHEAGICFEIPIRPEDPEARPALRGRLRIEVRPWS